MASIAIVTSRCYLLCEAINHITVNERNDSCQAEEAPFDGYNKKPKKKKKKLSKTDQEKLIQVAPYQIVIDFVPISGANTVTSASISKRSDNHVAISITVYGRDRAISLFTEIVKQIREQIPDQPYLDKIVESFLMGEADGNLPR